MKNQLKQTYVPCEVKVTEFNVEREFANGSGIGASNAFNNVVNSSSTWEMNADGGEYKNEQYTLDGDIPWFE